MNIGDIKRKAKFLFKDNYGICLLAGLVASFVSVSDQIMNKTNPIYSLINGLFSVIISFIGAGVGYINNNSDAFYNGGIRGLFSGATSIMTIVVGILVFAICLFGIMPLKVGICNFFVQNEDGTANMGDIVDGYRHNYLNVVKILFIMYAKTCLWTLLFIVPGIIKFYEYFAIPYILVEYPDISVSDAFEMSKSLTDGYKMKLFLLSFSFIGWYILMFFTCGFILPLWTIPYHNQALACAYLEIRQNSEYEYEDTEDEDEDDEEDTDEDDDTEEE